MAIKQHDRQILRELAEKVALLSQKSSNIEKKEMWTKHTDLDKTNKPALLVHLWPLAWHEVMSDDKTLLCEDETAREYERDMRQRIWSVENLYDDTVIEPVIHYPNCVNIIPFEKLAFKMVYSTDEVNDESFNPQTYVDDKNPGACKIVNVIHNEKDIDLICDPIVEVDYEQREVYKIEAEEIFGVILDVIPKGVYFTFRVVDDWFRLRGMENVYMDLIDRPEWTHVALQRIADNYKKRFQMCEKLGVWGDWNKSTPLGSSGLRFNPQIPNYEEIMVEGRTQLKDTWGITAVEFFSSVSPAMHEEFSLKYDLQLAKMFKYVNVGCCEPLSDKMDYVKKIPNARRVSISEWCDFEKAGKEIGTDYIYAYKPAGVPFVDIEINETLIRKEIERVLQASKGCTTEMILNIGGTLGQGNCAQKLINWTKIASKAIDKAYK